MPQHKALLSLSLFPTMPLKTDISEVLSAQLCIAPSHTQQPFADPLILMLGTTAWQAWQLSSCLHRSYKVWLLPLTRHHWPSTWTLTSWGNISLTTCLEITRKISFSCYISSWNFLLTNITHIYRSSRKQTNVPLLHFQKAAIWSCATS